MFTVNEYKIVFKRRWHQPRDGKSVPNSVPVLENDGRYDTVCEIYIEDLEVPRFTGVAKLHPNDQVDRIVGKKIALRNAIGVAVIEEDGNRTYNYNCADFYRPDVRTAIWKAFCQWVSQWPNQPAGKAHPVMQKPR